MYRQLIKMTIVVVALVTGMVALPSQAEQVALTPTTIRIDIATTTPLPTVGQPPTDPPPTFTPTLEGPPQLAPKEGSSAINVRAQADIDSQILGTIRPGETYVVSGRLFRWLQIRFDPSPSGVAYVYDELVDIVSGNEADIPDLTQSALPTQNTVLDETATYEALLLTPGFELTQANDIQEIEAPSGVIVPEGEGDLPEILPTFTYPPNLVALAPTEEGIGEVTTTPVPNGIELPISEGVAPIVPIVVLASLGVIGLLLSSLFR